MRCISWRRRWCWRRGRVLRICSMAIGLLGLLAFLLLQTDIDRIRVPLSTIEPRDPLPDDFRPALVAPLKAFGAEGGVKLVTRELPLVQVPVWKNCAKIFRNNEPEIIAAVHSNYTGSVLSTGPESFLLYCNLLFTDTSRQATNAIRVCTANYI